MKKKNLRAVATLLIVAAAVFSCIGCSFNLSDYVDEETASEIASFGKSVIVEKGSEVVSEMVSDVADASSSLMSQLIEEGKKVTSTYGESNEDTSSSDVGNESGKESGSDSSNSGSTTKSGILNSTSDIGLRDVDGKGSNYEFTYDNKVYTAIRWEDHWKIMDSYLIENSNDMIIICQALIDVYPIHGADLESYRTADDMAYEWLQHNIAYAFLPEDNVWRQKSKDVDFNPDDQGKSFIEIYEQRTGKEFKWSEITGG